MARFSEVKTPLESFCAVEEIDLHHYNEKTMPFDKVLSLVNKYNKVAQASSSLWSGQTRPGGEEWAQEVCGPTLLTSICSTAFNRAVPDVSRLNKHYEAFSSEVYGETSYEQLELMIDEIGFTENDVFVDLGSGVGHLVCYVAGRTKVQKAVGIEKARFPSSCAQLMQDNFRGLMKWHGKRFRPFELHHGDFLDPQYRSLITEEATIIFINNFAFTAELEKRIKDDIIKNCQPGIRIISTKAYARKRAPEELCQRDLADLAMLVNVKNLRTVSAPASWTGAQVPYFLHTVDPGKIERYFDLCKSKKSSSSSLAAEDRRSSSKSSRGSPSDSSKELTPGCMSNSGIVLPEISPGEDSDVLFEDATEEFNAFAPRKRPKPIYTDEGAEDEEYKPFKKRSKPKGDSNRPRGRPKKANTPKSPPKAPRNSALAELPEDTRNVIDAMHETIKRQSREFQDTPSPSTLSPPPLPEGAADPVNPYEELTLQVGQGIEEFAVAIQEIKLREALEMELEMERRRYAELMTCVNALFEMNEAIMQIALAHLKMRLMELEMAEVCTPAELLQRSKQIVHSHRDITVRCSSVEHEVAALESNLRSALHSAADVIIEKLNFRSGEVELLIAHECSQDNDPYIRLIEESCEEAGIPCPQWASQSQLPSILPPSTSSTTAAIVSSSISCDADSQLPDNLPNCDPPHQGIVSGLPQQLGTVVRKNRVRPRVSSSKRGGGKADATAPSEEVERQIKEIVQKALEVDSAAKEKERKARSANEKRSRAEKALAADKGPTQPSNPVGLLCASQAIIPCVPGTSSSDADGTNSLLQNITRNLQLALASRIEPPSVREIETVILSDDSTPPISPPGPPAVVDEPLPQNPINNVNISPPPPPPIREPSPPVTSI